MYRRQPKCLKDSMGAGFYDGCGVVVGSCEAYELGQIRRYLTPRLSTGI